jgi:hypothetical protein
MVVGVMVMMRLTDRIGGLILRCVFAVMVVVCGVGLVLDGVVGGVVAGLEGLRCALHGERHHNRHAQHGEPPACSSNHRQGHVSVMPEAAARGKPGLATIRRARAADRLTGRTNFVE